MQEVKKEVNLLVIILLLVLSVQINAQIKQDSIPKRILPKLFIQTSKTAYNPGKTLRLPIKKNIAIEKMPLFCKLEELLLATSQIPVRFRLGSLDYVDQLEGKN